MASKPVLYICAGWLVLAPLVSAQWVNLLNGRNLDGWESVGDGVWTVMRDGTLLGQRDLKKAEHQAWLYTRREFGEFDLHVEWWTRLRGNSGVSIRDTSRAKWAVTGNWDADKTPSHIGYEIQIADQYPDDPYPSGSVYLFDKARTGFQFDNDWNTFDIESRAGGITVKLNGHEVSHYAGEPGRSRRGPIGLQLHDRSSIVMFRNIRIRETGTADKRR